MRFRYQLAVAAMLTACGLPCGHFRDATPVRITVEKNTFDIRQRETLVEVIRLNARYAPRLGSVADDAKRAVEQATGCRIVRLFGDAAVILARIECRNES